MNPEDLCQTIAAFQAPDRSRYPELDGLARDELYRDCYGGGGLYLAARMARTLDLRPGGIVLDLGCGKCAASLFLARRFGVRVIAADLWSTASEIYGRIAASGLRDRILPLHLDARQELPFAQGYFDAIFCMNSFSFFGGDPATVHRIAGHLAAGGRLCIGSEVLTSEFTSEQLRKPPHAYAFRLPPPNEDVDVFTDDFCRQHTPSWWRSLLANAGGLEVEHCEELDDAGVLYQELVRYEFENDVDLFDVNICLEQMEWGRSHQPAKSLFVLTARAA